MNTTEVFLVAMLIVFSAPYLVWRLGGTDYWAPLVVVQIVLGILLGPGVLGAALPQYYAFVFTPAVIQSLNGIAWWAVMLFVWIAGIELDLGQAWRQRRDSGVTAGLALGMPLAVRALGVGMSRAVQLAGRILKWQPGEAALIGWLLQTKALIMIIFANVLLDKRIITSSTFTALLLMALASTMLTVPMVAPMLQRHEAGGAGRFVVAPPRSTRAARGFSWPCQTRAVLVDDS